MRRLDKMGLIFASNKCIFIQNRFIILFTMLLQLFYNAHEQFTQTLYFNSHCTQTNFISGDYKIVIQQREDKNISKITSQSTKSNKIFSITIVSTCQTEQLQVLSQLNIKRIKRALQTKQCFIVQFTQKIIIIFQVQQQNHILPESHQLVYNQFQLLNSQSRLIYPPLQICNLINNSNVVIISHHKIKAKGFLIDTNIILTSPTLFYDKIHQIRHSSTTIYVLFKRKTIKATCFLYNNKYQVLNCVQPYEYAIIFLKEPIEQYLLDYFILSTMLLNIKQVRYYLNGQRILGDNFSEYYMFFKRRDNSKRFIVGQMLLAEVNNYTYVAGMYVGQNKCILLHMELIQNICKWIDQKIFSSAVVISHFMLRIIKKDRFHRINISNSMLKIGQIQSQIQNKQTKNMNGQVIFYNPIQSFILFQQKYSLDIDLSLIISQMETIICDYLTFYNIQIQELTYLQHIIAVYYAIQKQKSKQFNTVKQKQINDKMQLILAQLIQVIKQKDNVQIDSRIFLDIYFRYAYLNQSNQEQQNCLKYYKLSVNRCINPLKLLAIYQKIACSQKSQSQNQKYQIYFQKCFQIVQEVMKGEIKIFYSMLLHLQKSILLIRMHKYDSMIDNLIISLDILNNRPWVCNKNILETLRCIYNKLQYGRKQQVQKTFPQILQSFIVITNRIKLIFEYADSRIT